MFSTVLYLRGALATVSYLVAGPTNLKKFRFSKPLRHKVEVNCRKWRLILDTILYNKSYASFKMFNYLINWVLKKHGLRRYDRPVRRYDTVEKGLCRYDTVRRTRRSAGKSHTVRRFSSTVTSGPAGSKASMVPTLEILCVWSPETLVYSNGDRDENRRWQFSWSRSVFSREWNQIDPACTDLIVIDFNFIRQSIAISTRTEKMRSFDVKDTRARPY